MPPPSRVSGASRRSDARAGRTVIVIAHELDMVIDADHIVVLRDGAVVEQGTHTDLVSRSGAYRSMWESLQVERVA